MRIVIKATTLDFPAIYYTSGLRGKVKYHPIFIDWETESWRGHVMTLRSPKVTQLGEGRADPAACWLLGQHKAGSPLPRCVWNGELVSRDPQGPARVLMLSGFWSMTRETQKKRSLEASSILLPTVSSEVWYKTAWE